MAGFHEEDDEDSWDDSSSDFESGASSASNTPHSSPMLRPILKINTLFNGALDLPAPSPTAPETTLAPLPPPATAAPKLQVTVTPPATPAKTCFQPKHGPEHRKPGTRRTHDTSPLHPSHLNPTLEVPSEQPATAAKAADLYVPRSPRIRAKSPPVIKPCPHSSPSMLSPLLSPLPSPTLGAVSKLTSTLSKSVPNDIYGGLDFSLPPPAKAAAPLPVGGITTSLSPLTSKLSAVLGAGSPTNMYSTLDFSLAKHALSPGEQVRRGFWELGHLSCVQSRIVCQVG